LYRLKNSIGQIIHQSFTEIVCYVLMLVLRSSLYQLFANTQAGAHFADKTRQALAFEPLRSR
jgi:hypothetical protein